MDNRGWAAQNVCVVSTILDPSGKEVGKAAASPVSIPAGGEQTYSREMVVSRPLLWSLEERNLYRLVADAPQAYEGQPEFQFIKDASTTWDETRGLQGSPAETITVARRKGREWFVGSITNWSPREVAIPLKFLGAGKYTAEIYRDAADADQMPQHVTIGKKLVRQADTLTFIWRPAAVALSGLYPPTDCLGWASRLATRNVPISTSF